MIWLLYLFFRYYIPLIIQYINYKNNGKVKYVLI